MKDELNYLFLVYYYLILLVAIVNYLEYLGIDLIPEGTKYRIVKIYNAIYDTELDFKGISHNNTLYSIMITFSFIVFQLIINSI